MISDILTLNTLFARAAVGREDALAVKDAREQCSYRELDERVAGLARELRGLGVGPDVAVVVYAERSVATVVAILAVLRAGGAFVPVSLDTPPGRLAFILGDARPRVLLVDRQGRELLARSGERVDFGGAQVLAIDGPRSEIGSHSEDGSRSEDGGRVVLASWAEDSDLAYIIYTSGTSGHPKGVMIEHGSITRRFFDWDLVFGLREKPPRVLQVARLGFDVFTADLVKAFGAGGSLVICPTEAVLDPAQFHRWLVDEAIDYVDLVPAVLRPLIDHLEASGQDLASLRILNCGADLWTKKEYQRSREIARVRRLFNGYGVTECAVENTLFCDVAGVESRLDSWSTLPIGRANASDVMHIVDDSLEPVAAGTIGQICIGGPCVARGYLNRPELDARAFFVREGVRFYQTGDLGRMDADGIIEFLGRQDFQIKVNGHRIELEEIETVLERLPAVAQAVVVFDDHRKLLTACVRTVEGGRFSAAEAPGALARQLPRYMVPGRIVAVDRFPLNANGKVDRVVLAREVAALAEEPQASEPVEAQDLDALRGCRTAADVQAALARRDIDLVGLVHEFVKPQSTFSLGLEPASAGSAVDVVVLLDDPRSMKRRKDEVSGHAVRYLPAADESGTRLGVSIGGVEIRLHFMVASHAER